ncbi:hypothetical protein DFH08DRAFT_972727 [Mycena albidolilacea]|uniref:DUF6532 domain-containing protein n=1 Tax=Mycena albidolilacea TaxID=1033008 RepID=A0AAD7EDC7_9AGAR|nr:hypothetical protein DFH08DRAFT_972727 [Mycena albidolilacea]
MAQDPDANSGSNGGFEDEDHGGNNNNNNNNSDLDSDDNGGDGDYHGGNSGEDDADSDVFMLDATGSGSDTGQEDHGYYDDSGNGGYESDFHSEDSEHVQEGRQSEGVEAQQVAYSYKGMLLSQRQLKSHQLDEGGNQEPVHNNQGSQSPYMLGQSHLQIISNSKIQNPLTIIGKIKAKQPKPQGGNSGGSQNRHSSLQDRGQKQGQDGGQAKQPKPQGGNGGGSQNDHSGLLDGRQDGGQMKRPQPQEQRKSVTTTETTEKTKMVRQTASKQTEQTERAKEQKQHGATGRKIQGQGLHESEDVLTQHRKANKACKAPDPKNLEVFSKKQQASNGGRSENCRPVQAPQVTQVAQVTDNSDDSSSEDEGGMQRKTRTMQVAGPTNECFFPKDWRKVIRRTKDKVLISLILSDLFPSGEDFKDTDIAKMLTDAIAHIEHTTDIQLSIDIYRDHKADILDLVWNNISTFRTRIKDKAEVIVATYYAPDIKGKPDFERGSGQAEAETVASRNVKALVDEGLYHHNGKDENNRTNNFMAPALQVLCQEVLEMTPNCLAKNYPDEFKGAYPPQFIAAIIPLAHGWSAASQKMNSGVNTIALFNSWRLWKMSRSTTGISPELNGRNGHERLPTVGAALQHRPKDQLRTLALDATYRDVTDDYSAPAAHSRCCAAPAHLCDGLGYDTIICASLA